MRGAVLVASLVGMLLAGSVGAASTARVTIRDAALAPKVARVSAPGSVTWTNKGAFPHHVASTTGAFKGFLLKVNARKTIRFTRSGSYPYLVDGKRCGFVVAGAAQPGKNCAVAGGGRGGQPPPGSDVRKKTLRYDIDIVASLHTVETFSGYNNPAANGTLDRKLDWTGKWRRVEVEAQIVGAAAFLGTKQATSTRGTINGKLKYSDSRSDSGPCSGDIDYLRNKAKALVSGSKPQRGKRSVSFDAFVVNANAVDELTRSKQKANCKDRELGLPRWSDTSRLVVLGVNIHHPPGLSIHPMDTSWSREAASGTPFPLDRLVAGRGFSIDTGVRTSRLTQDGYVERFTGRVKYVFRPAR